MGKSTMGLGQFRGKVGGLVFAKGDAGEQIVRQYQPIVKNPRTDAQLAQRAKVNLAGQISRLFSKEDVYPFGNNGRSRRGNFNKVLIDAIEVVKSGTDFQATLDYPKIEVSRGPINLGLANAPQVSFAPDDLSIDARVAINGGNFEEGDVAELYVLLFKDGDANYKPSVMKLSTDKNDFNITTGDQRINTSVFIPSVLAGASVFASVYAVVKRPDASFSVRTNLMGGSQNEIRADISTAETLSGMNFSNSVYLGTAELAG